jgi:membrane-bound serine protease (ClpP class)
VSGPYLDVTLEDSHADSKESQKANIGDEGTAMTFLRPSGKMKIGNNVFDVITESEFLEKGTAIVIADIKGNRVIVSKKDIEKV